MEQICGISSNDFVQLKMADTDGDLLASASVCRLMFTFGRILISKVERAAHGLKAG